MPCPSAHRHGRVDRAAFGVVEKPLSTWERIYNIGAVRKLALLVLLALIWEVYARSLDNPLLFPTFCVDGQAFVDGLYRAATCSRKALTSLQACC